MGRSRRIFLLLVVWVAIQWLTCVIPVRMFRNDYLRCLHDPTCRGQDVASEWDRRRAWASIACAQFIQPIGSAILIGSLTSSRSWQSHVGKAIGLGLVMVVISSVVGLLIYDHYPRPSYWSQGNTVLEAYFIFPLFPLLSAILGGLVSGTLAWKWLFAKQKNSDSVPS